LTAIAKALKAIDNAYTGPVRELLKDVRETPGFLPGPTGTRRNTQEADTLGLAFGLRRRRLESPAVRTRELVRLSREQIEAMSRFEDGKQGRLFEIHQTRIRSRKRQGKTPVEVLAEEAERRQKLSKQSMSSGQTRMKQIISEVDMEIELLGKLERPRQHARQAIEFQSAAMEAFGENTKSATAAADAFNRKLDELGRAERLNRIAESIGESFATAFEEVVIGAGKASDAIKALGRDIARSVLRQTVTDPLAQGVAGVFKGLFSPAPTLDAGGSVLKTGLAIVHKGETFSGVNNDGGGVNVIINNNSGTPLSVESQERQGRDLILSVVAQNALGGGQLRDVFG